MTKLRPALHDVPTASKTREELVMAQHKEQLAQLIAQLDSLMTVLGGLLRPSAPSRADWAAARAVYAKVKTGKS